MSDTGLDLDDLRNAVQTTLRARLEQVGDDVPGENGRPVDRELWEDMARLGWLALSIDEVHGGLGLGHAHLAVLYEELGRTLATVPAFPTLLAAAAISTAGNDGQKGRLLPRIAVGDLIVAILLPEPGLAPALSGGRLSHQFDHVLFGDAAELVLLPVMTPSGAALAAVATTAPGVSVSHPSTVDLTRSMARISLEEVEIAEADLLHLDHSAVEALRDHAAMAVAMDSVGGADAILGRTVDYMCIRTQFGRQIGSFQALKHRAAYWKIQLEAALALVRHAGEAMDAGVADRSVIVSSAKAHASETYAAIAGDAVQLHGGIGFTWEHPCHLFLKRAMLNQELFGSVAAHKDRVARLTFGAGEGAAVASSPQIQDGAGHGSNR